jgi:hypothetical protein
MSRPHKHYPDQGDQGPPPDLRGPCCHPGCSLCKVLDEEHAAGIAAARNVAGYKIGHPDWADLLIDAYFNPERAMRELRR